MPRKLLSLGWFCVRLWFGSLRLGWCLASRSRRPECHLAEVEMLCLKTLLHGEHIAAELNSSSVAPSCPPESFLLLFENLSSWERLSPIPLFQEPLAPFQSHASITQPACPASPELGSSVRPRAVRLCPRAFNVDTSCWLNMLQASGPQP